MATHDEVAELFGADRLVMLDRAVAEDRGLSEADAKVLCDVVQHSMRSSSSRSRNREPGWATRQPPARRSRTLKTAVTAFRNATNFIG
ncbi:hypothetical protein [Actinoallomurus soli]|uniref:hypothetical protein n=1 Tax=Actinoallomurus soli TaxID=2952535 RepID=UPI002092EC59|nr:hypothetical protein [Actinoallomurus soli]MCO5972419.1 hypothetical protein [Actinoallomurus soli]